MGQQVRLTLPASLRTLAGIDGEVVVELEGEVTLAAALDALEAKHPVLRGTLRDHSSGRRRPFIRFFACEEDLSLGPPDQALPERVVAGAEPLIVIGAIAGG